MIPPLIKINRLKRWNFMYGYEYWIKKGYSEEDAIERSKGNVRCFICSSFFPKNQSLSSGKHICSELCNQVKSGSFKDYDGNWEINRNGNGKKCRTPSDF